MHSSSLMFCLTIFSASLKTIETPKCGAEDSWELPWTARKSSSVSAKGNQSWIFIGSTDAEAPILWPPDVKNWLLGKDPDAGKVWRQEDKETAEGKMVGWHQWLCGHDFEQTPGDCEGQESLASYSPWGWKRVRHSLVTEQQQQSACVCVGYI